MFPKAQIIFTKPELKLGQHRLAYGLFGQVGISPTADDIDRLPWRYRHKL